jgi:hypothetical protein
VKEVAKRIAVEAGEDHLLDGIENRIVLGVQKASCACKVDVVGCKFGKVGWMKRNIESQKEIGNLLAVGHPQGDGCGLEASKTEQEGFL